MGYVLLIDGDSRDMTIDEIFRIVGSYPSWSVQFIGRNINFCADMFRLDFPHSQPLLNKIYAGLSDSEILHTRSDSELTPQAVLDTKHNGRFIYTVDCDKEKDDIKPFWEWLQKAYPIINWSEFIEEDKSKYLTVKYENSDWIMVDDTDDFVCYCNESELNTVVNVYLDDTVSDDKYYNQIIKPKLLEWIE